MEPGGATQAKTLDIASHVKAQLKVPVASHLTCVGATVDDLRAYLTRASERGVDYIVALRGDPPQGQESFVVHEGGLRYANELVALIRKEFKHFGIAVGGYPEVHQEAPGPAADLDNLKRKVETGADVVITQLFYENESFLRFRDRYESAGINAPLVPGILPVTNLGQIQRITNLCGAQLPPNFVQQLAQNDNPEWQLQVGIEQASAQVAELIAAGIPGLHFYVLNKSKAIGTVLANVALPRSQ